MFIARIHVSNYRCLNDVTVDFRPGVNVIVGENNAGKTALLKALGLVFNRRQRERLDVPDFYQGIDCLTEAPSITVTVSIRSSADDTVEDRALVASWLTTLTSPWEATLTYRYFLPPSDAAKFADECAGNTSREAFWGVLEGYLPKYVSRIFAGHPDAQLRAEPDALSKFDYRSVEAIRDVEAELFAGTNPLLKQMLRNVLDVDLFDKAEPTQVQEQAHRRGVFRQLADGLQQHMLGRLDRKRLFHLVDQTGASDGGELDLGGGMSENDALSAMKLFVNNNGFSLPATHNGLGYNNLVYISLVLSQLAAWSSDQAGENAVAFPLLVIEEPEAHLHPTLQYRLLKHLRDRVGAAVAGSSKDIGSRQVFITSHSTHITAASDLDSVICLSGMTSSRGVKVSYPGRVFGSDPEGTKSKQYVERYLDATRSSMLFARGIILVEGIAEQLLVPRCAEMLGVSLEEHQVIVVPVGGSTFRHFLPIFGVGVAEQQLGYALDCRVACTIDADPSRKEKSKGARRKSCWPHQVNLNPESFEYYPVSSVVQGILSEAAERPNVSIHYGVKTLEYDLAIANPCSPLLRNQCCSCPSDLGDPPDPLQGCSIDARLAELCDEQDINDLHVVDSHRRQVQFAMCYLLSGQDTKGQYAYDLASRLRIELQKPPATRESFVVPEPIKDAILWACRLESGWAAHQ